MQPTQGVAEACGDDGAQVLVCEGGRFAASRPCRGPAGCKVDGRTGLACDQSLGSAGEPCLLMESRSFTCSVDRQAVLECERGSRPDRPIGSGTLKVDRECPTPAGCKQGADWAYCDFTGVASARPAARATKTTSSARPTRRRSSGVTRRR